MTDDQINLLGEMVSARVDKHLKEFAEIVGSQGSAFGVAVIISSCADVAGAAIASHQDPDIQEAGLLAFMLALHKSVEKYSVKFEAQQAIEKAKA